MIYVVIILVLAVLVLGYALHTQSKKDKQQAEEQQQLLADYQRRVDEQQKLLEDYRALEKNFDNVGQGYEQALLAFDKMEEDKQKAKTVNDALQKTVASLQEANGKLQDTLQRKSEAITKVVTDLQQIVSTQADNKLATLVGKLADLDEIQPDMPPLERTENILVAQIAEDAVKLSGIDKAQYVQFKQVVEPTAAATMLSTNQQKAVRALARVLDNALKFTTEGCVTLSVDVDMEKMQAIYKVEDTGTGIPADEAEHIFEPYVKLNQYFDGDGTGLTIARNIARRLNGDLVLDTAYEGPGARFVLTLPI